MTVAEFALGLLGNPDYLGIKDSPPRASLFTLNEEVGVYIETLADDGATSVHKEVASFLPGMLKRAKVTLDLVTLRSLTPSLKDWQIVKAVGRLKRPKAAQELLIACVEDDCLDPATRFAAASALTRHTDRASSRALRVHREVLNRLDDARWGDFFVETLNARRAYEKHMRSIGPAGSWRKRGVRQEQVLRIITCDHPLALDDLMDPPAFVTVVKHTEVHQTIVNSIVAISENLDRFHQPWSTYSDTAFKLDLFIRHLRWLRGLMEQSEAEERSLLSEEQCAEIERNISRFIEPVVPYFLQTHPPIFF